MENAPWKVFGCNHHRRDSARRSVTGFTLKRLQTSLCEAVDLSWSRTLLSQRGTVASAQTRESRDLLWRMARGVAAIRPFARSESRAASSKHSCNALENCW